MRNRPAFLYHSEAEVAEDGLLVHLLLHNKAHGREHGEPAVLLKGRVIARLEISPAAAGTNGKIYKTAPSSACLAPHAMST